MHDQSAHSIPCQQPSTQLICAAASRIWLAAIAFLLVLGGCNADNPVEENGSVDQIAFSPRGGAYPNPQDVHVVYDGLGKLNFSVDGRGYDVGADGTIRIEDGAAITAWIERDGRQYGTVTSSYEIVRTTPVPTPAFSPSSSWSPNPVTVSLTCSGNYAGQKIYYTTDTVQRDFSPATWTPYQTPILVSRSVQMRAIAVADGRTNSAIGYASFQVYLDAPSIRTGSDTGGYADSILEAFSSQTVMLNSASTGTSIHYTTDGTNPTASSPRYEKPFQVSSTTTIAAVAVRDEVVSAVRRRRIAICARPPVFNPAGGVISDTQMVAISSATSGASIHYTTDGREPTTSSTLYTGPFRLSGSTVVRAIAVKSGLSIASATVARYVAPPPWNTSISYGSLRDTRDGKIYRTVKIGRQTWMAENLDYAGAHVDTGTCFANSSDSCARYGRLYTWNEALAGFVWSSAVPSGIRGVCPSEWHLPSRDEWDTLRTFAAASSLAGSNQVGGALKATTTWMSSGYPGRDLFGFRALAGGYDAYGSGQYGFFWSTTAGSLQTSAMGFGLYYHMADVNWLEYPRTSRFSIRCIGN